MKTTALRLYGKKDIRLEAFELPEITENEILAKVVTDSACMSSYKAVIQGNEHKRVPKDIEEKPIILGHELCGTILKVGKRWSNQFKEGDNFVIQPALNYKGSLDAPGYSYQYIGGDAQYIIIPSEVMETNNLIKYNSSKYYLGSLSEPISCIIGAFNASYHTVPGTYNHIMGTKPQGNMLVLAGGGPMGLCAIDYVLNAYENKPKLLIVTDIDNSRIERAKRYFAPTDIKVEFLCTKNIQDQYNELMMLSNNEGFDDVFVFAPSSQLLEIGNQLLSRDGCLNFFAGPTEKDFEARVNFYDVHYASTHIVGTSGGNRDDMIKAVKLIEEGKLSPEHMITHIGGLDSSLYTTLNLPLINGAKKLIYTGISLPLTSIEDFDRLSKEEGKHKELFTKLHLICEKNQGAWCKEAEDCLLENGTKLEM